MYQFYYDVMLAAFVCSRRKPSIRGMIYENPSKKYLLKQMRFLQNWSTGHWSSIPNYFGEAKIEEENSFTPETLVPWNVEHIKC